MLKIIQTDWGVFDLALAQTGDDLEANALQTLLYAVLFTDAEAPASRLPDFFDRRGWWHDPQMGTGLWHVRRQGLTQAARQETMQMVQRALAAQSSLSNITVTDVTNAPDNLRAGNISALILNISGAHNGRAFNQTITL